MIFRVGPWWRAVEPLNKEGEVVEMNGASRSSPLYG